MVLGEQTIAEHSPLRGTDGLEMVLRDHFSGAESENRMANESPAIPTTGFVQAKSLVDWSLALDIVGGDSGLLAEVLEAFLVEAPRQSQAIDRAVKAGDASALHLAAHTLKSSLRYLGAKDSQDLASRLEQAGRMGAIAKMEVEPLAAELHRRMERILIEADAEWRRLRGGSR